MADDTPGGPLSTIVLARADLDHSLARLLPETIARREQAVPISHTGDTLVAATLVASDAVAGRLAAGVGCPVHLVGAVGSHDIAIGLEALYGAPCRAAMALEEAVVHHLTRVSQLDGQVRSALRERPRPAPTPVEDHLIARGVPGEAVAQAVALTLHAPYLRLNMWPLRTVLVRVLPRAFTEAHDMAPVAVYRGRLLVALARASDLSHLKEVARLTGLPVSPVVSARDSIRAALTEAWDASPISDSTNNHLPTEHHGRARPRPPDLLARREGETDPRVEPEVTTRLPAALATRLGGLPLRQERTGVVVACRQPLVEPIRQLYREFLGRRVVDLVMDEPTFSDLVARWFTTAQETPEIVWPEQWADEEPFDRFLLSLGFVTREQISVLRRDQRTHDVDVPTSLLNTGLMTEDDLAEALGLWAGTPWLHVDHWCSTAEVSELRLRSFARRRDVLPLAHHGSSLLLAVVYPGKDTVSASVAGVSGLAIRRVVTTRSSLARALRRIDRAGTERPGEEPMAMTTFLNGSSHPMDARFAVPLAARRDPPSFGLPATELDPDGSASHLLSAQQKGMIVGALAATGVLSILQPFRVFIVLVALLTLIYLATSLYKLYLIFKGQNSRAVVIVPRDDVAALDERNLPTYTILVPLYREAAVLPNLVEAIQRLDYPRAKLDVKLLFEEDDAVTIQAARASCLPSHFQVLIVPHGHPKSKPRACNYGLRHARGSYTVIYDAEDAPDPDQLKKVLIAFRKTGGSVSCIQCKLNYYNQDQNLLTRWFTSEYSMWFDLFLPGLNASHAPIPLGGTSNHFPTALLRKLGAWDPYNVTEDADLGIRLFKQGYTTTLVDSTTWEEANSRTANWIRQRSRWTKGYMQTWLVHMRHPVALYRALGPKGFFSFQATIGGAFLVLLANPIFWLLTVGWFVTQWGVIHTIFPGPLFFIGSISLFIGNFVYLYASMLGCLHRGYYSLAKYTLAIPLYWFLMSLAAWKGFLQLLRNPWYWEKTVHGLYQGPVFRVGEAPDGD